MPPVAPSGSTSRRVAFQASLGPVLRTSRVKLPDCASVIVAGPVFVTSSSGGTNAKSTSSSAVLTTPPSRVMNSSTGLPLASRKLRPSV